MTTSENPYVPRPAAGEGADTFSAPELFYLANQTLIDEWASLSGRASGVVSAWLRDVAGADLEALAEEHGLLHHYVRVGKWRNSLLVVPDTPTVDGRPVIGLGVGWSSNDVGRSGVSRGGRPYVGINVDVSTEHGKNVREAVLEGNGRAERDAHNYRGDRAWPVWKYVDLEGAWWTDLDATRDRLIDEVSVVLDIFGDRFRSAAALSPDG